MRGSKHRKPIHEACKASRDCKPGGLFWTSSWLGGGSDSTLTPQIKRLIKTSFFKKIFLLDKPADAATSKGHFATALAHHTVLEP